MRSINNETRNTVTEQMSWVGGLVEVKVYSVVQPGTIEAVLETQHGTHSLFNNLECNSLMGGHSATTARSHQVRVIRKHSRWSSWPRARGVWLGPSTVILNTHERSNTMIWMFVVGVLALVIAAGLWIYASLEIVEDIT